MSDHRFHFDIEQGNRSSPNYQQCLQIDSDSCNQTSWIAFSFARSQHEQDTLDKNKKKI
jgi:hypothetical protein